MEFIHHQKTHNPHYNPNTRHCLLGQDGDLIMLGLATHEPHFALLREEVIFDQSRKPENQKRLVHDLNSQQKKKKKRDGTTHPSNDHVHDNKDDEEDDNDDSNPQDLTRDLARERISTFIESYIHNSNFELLHMSILRDYLAYEFETRDILPTIPFELEPIIDDFVFMPFFVGNDFLVRLLFCFV